MPTAAARATAAAPSAPSTTVFGVGCSRCLVVHCASCQHKWQSALINCRCLGPIITVFGNAAAVAAATRQLLKVAHVAGEIARLYADRMTTTVPVSLCK